MNRIEITATITAETNYSVQDVQAHAADRLSAALGSRNVTNGHEDGVRVVAVNVSNVQAVTAPAVDLATLSDAEKAAAEAAVRALRS